ncbi:MAG TPA: AI-2E family transporter, partial [Parvularculaceae bacterium]|nr:AI-2E family transporter [Parvularculaceae bacterium]
MSGADHLQAHAPAETDAGVRLKGSAQVFFALALATLIAAIAYFGRAIFIPVVVAGFLSFLMFTLKETIRQGPLVGRFLPNWLCYLFAFALIISIFVLFIEIIRENVEALIDTAPLYEERLRKFTQDGIRYLDSAGVLPEDFIGGVDQLRSTAISMINPVLSEVGSAVSSLTANSVTIFLYTVFMLLERGRIFRKINLLSAREESRAAVNETIGDIASLVRQYITVKTVTNLITAAISFIIMHFVGVDFAGFWALLIFALNFIPIVGAISAISLPVILALVQPEGGGVQTAALALVLLVGAEQTMSSGIEPRLIGKSLNLSPLVILLSLAVWGTLWGFAGMLLAVPISVTIM